MLGTRLGGIFWKGIALAVPFFFAPHILPVSQCRKENCYEDRRCKVAADPAADLAEGVWDQKAEKELRGDRGGPGRCAVPPPNILVDFGAEMWYNMALY